MEQSTENDRKKYRSVSGQMEGTNRKVAALLNLMGQILEIQGDNAFKIRAYYRASELFTGSLPRLPEWMRMLSPVLTE